MLSLPNGVSLLNGPGGLSKLAIANAAARAELFLSGAQVTSYTPTGGRDLLWLAPKSPFVAGKAIRGGIPLCGPWFGPHPTRSDLPAHGFLRNRTWTLVRGEALSEDRTLVDLALRSEVETLAIWPHPFHAHCTVVVGPTLEVELTIRNTGSAPFLLSEALHTYLAVGDVRRVELHGLSGAPYLDRVGGRESRHRQGPEPITFTGETDRVYLSHEDAAVLVDPVWNRRLAVRKQGSGATVVWTPWSDRAPKMPDIGEDWPGFACVETANAADATVVVPPSMSHHLRMELEQR